ncbi:MAG: glycine betaine ABC transporter substrate-binding protein [Pseudomonadota bacterium]
MTTPFVIGQIGLSFHAAATAVLTEVLKDLGHTVEIREAPHEEMFRMHQAGEVDLVCSAWLPDSHQVYIAPYEAEIEKLGVIYTPYCIWGVPTYAPADLTSVEDLARPDIASQFRKLIQGINPGAGISRFSRQMVDDYGLATLGFHFENGSLDDCTGAFLDTIESEELAVVPLWRPQWLHNEVEMRELQDPRGLLGGQDDATLVLRSDAKAKLSATGLQFLRNVSVGNTGVSEIDHAMCRNGVAPGDAARAWISRNQSLIESWIA